MHGLWLHASPEMPRRCFAFAPMFTRSRWVHHTSRFFVNNSLVDAISNRILVSDVLSFYSWPHHRCLVAFTSSSYILFLQGGLRVDRSG